MTPEEKPAPDSSASSLAHMQEELGTIAEVAFLELTQLQEREAALQQIKEELERLVKKRTEALEREIDARVKAEARLKTYTEELERSNRELQHFASVASHDLQEPLRKVQAFGGRLAAKCGDALSPDGRRYLDRMLNASARMQTLIQDLLVYSRITTKAQPFRPVDLARIVREVVSDLETRIEQTGGRVELETLPTLDADPLQMRQLFQNLIGNALKFHRPDVPPVVTVRGQRLTEPLESGARDRWRITVADNGIGFEEKYVERIFGVFQRLHGRSSYEGTGIGLAICRKIAERHGGSITATSGAGSGATFLVTLPVKHAAEAEGVSSHVQQP